MKRLIVLILLAAVACLAYAETVKSDKGEASLPAGVQPVLQVAPPVHPALTTEATVDDIAAYEAMKVRYHALFERAVLGIATAAELTELNDLSATMSWSAFTPEVRDEGGNLDQGGVDTAGNCADATVIPPLSYGQTYSDTGVLDGDNECSVGAASPYNEVYYTITPSVSGYYFLRASRTGATAAVAAIRVMSGSCCAGATSVGFSSGTVATDCNEPASRVTYLRVTLTAGVQYWIHVGTSASTAGIVDPYEFSISLIECPVGESGVAHATCQTAQALAVGDSVLGDSAYISATTTPDWYSFTLSQVDSVRIFVGGREAGHCISGLYPSNTAAPLGAVDGRFSLWSSCSDSIGGDDDGGCSFDALKAFCLNPGTYYIKVYNYNVNDYVLKVTSLGPCTTNPVECSTLQPCGTPLEMEPNGTCADAANILSLDCNYTYYGVLCPGTERDYWYVPATTGSQTMTVIIRDGADCSVYPPSTVAFRVATTAAGLCTTPAGSFFAAATFGGCTPWPGGWIAVDRYVAAGQSQYSLTTVCGQFECPCPDVSGPNLAQVQGTCLGKIPFGAGASSGPSSFFFNVEQQYQITDLDVCLAITHTFDGDLDVYLITPWQDTLTLFEDVGSSGDNFWVTTLDDEAVTPIASGVAPFNGSFIPAEALAGADGFNALGIWELYIFDDAAGDTGYVHCVSLNISYDIILSVELSSFTAVAGDGNVTLNWVTASESDNDAFVVERNGAMVATIDATNSATGANYSWTDNGLTNGLAYQYSLYAVDVNGGRELLGSLEATPQGGAGVVSEYALYQNYPNPFNPTTNISFDLVEAGQVSLTVYNVMGQKVAELVNGTMNAGRHVVSFDAAGLSSGLYLYKMEANGFSAQHKMLLLK